MSVCRNCGEDPNEDPAERAERAERARERMAEVILVKSDRSAEKLGRDEPHIWTELTRLARAHPELLLAKLDDKAAIALAKSTHLSF